MLKITQAEFISSCTKISDKPKRLLPEFAFIGRSNVGKSSLINSLCGNKSLAHTSSTPGKTQCINHFLINDSWYLVDLPGYGFAKAPAKVRASIEQVINEYIHKSKEMVLLFVLLDSRHDIQKNDLDFLINLGENGIPFSIIFTKGDKLSKNGLESQVAKNKKFLMNYWEELPPVFTTSSLTGDGREELLKYISLTLNSLKK